MQSKHSNSPSDAPGDAGRMLERFSQRFDELRQVLRQNDPQQIARRSGAELSAVTGSTGTIGLSLWGRRVVVAYPEYQVYQADGQTPAPLLDTAFLLYYLSSADGAPFEDRWIAFSDLPDGRFYNLAFQGYTGKELARAFGDDQPGFERAAQSLAGRLGHLGDVSYTFDALPRVAISVVYWRGDDDFPSNYQLLFDSSVRHYLPTDACAVLGSTLTRKLIRALQDT